jgi:tryptophanyl-tRNA synthetase
MTGPRHLGHYVSTMADWPELQKEGQLVIIIDDLIAAILYPRARREIQNRAFQTAKEFIATGIDLNENQIILTSMIPEVHELSLFTSHFISSSWCNALYKESFAGLLTSYQRKELQLPREPSLAEVIYPQIHLATLTLGLRANFFQGGEEMRGYLDIMQAMIEGFQKSINLRMPAFLKGSSTFLVGTDGRHMASENAIYISSTEEEIASALSKIESRDTFLKISNALKSEKLTTSLSNDSSITENGVSLMRNALANELRKFRESNISNNEIATILDNSAVVVREIIKETLVEVKKTFSLPGFI